MSVIISKNQQPRPVSSDRDRNVRKKLSSEQLKQKSQATKRGLAVLAEQARKKDREEIKPINPFELLSQVKWPELQKQVPIRASAMLENEMQNEIKKQDANEIKEEDEEFENREESDISTSPAMVINNTSSPFTVLATSMVNNASSQSWAAADTMTEARLQQLQSLLFQMASKASVNSKRSEFTVTLDPALFASTQLKIQVDEHGMEVDYSCGHAAETTWFGNHAAELTKRLTKALNCPVKIQSTERWSAASE